jgi:hypothetical protein
VAGTHTYCNAEMRLLSQAVLTEDRPGGKSLGSRFLDPEALLRDQPEPQAAANSQGSAAEAQSPTPKGPALTEGKIWL